MSILDIHTHRPAPYPEGVVSLRIDGRSNEPFELLPDQAYSAGIHPWDIPSIDLEGAHAHGENCECRSGGFLTSAKLEEIVANPQVVAIGECGIDLSRCRHSRDGAFEVCGVTSLPGEPKGGPLWRQLQIFKRHVELSESLKKPLIIHCVKADDVICGLRRDLHPMQPWVIHGFRGKPAAALALLKAGCHISFGENFNPGSVRAVLEYSPDRILAETDESSLPITDIIAHIDVSPSIIASNTAKVLVNDF